MRITGTMNDSPFEADVRDEYDIKTAIDLVLEELERLASERSAHLRLDIIPHIAETLVNDSLAEGDIRIGEVADGNPGLSDALPETREQVE